MEKQEEIMVNERIMAAIFFNGLKHKNVAEKLNICQEAFSQEIAKEVSGKREAEIMRAIDELLGGFTEETHDKVSGE
jgi:hypothetical protein